MHHSVPPKLKLHRVRSDDSIDHTKLLNIGIYTHPQIDLFIDSKGQISGLAELDGTGRVPLSQLPETIQDGLQYKGTWDCSLGAYPTTTSTGDYYVCSVAGTISGTYYEIADWLVYNGSTWDRVDGGAHPHALTHISGALDEIDGDLLDIDFSPSFYTPTSTGVSTSTGELASHLYGIDLAIGDPKLKISADDTTPDYLEGKLSVSDGSNTSNILEVTVLNDGGDETLQVQVDETKITHDSIISGTIASHDTSATGSQLDTLTDGSNADALHIHTANSLTIAHTDLSDMPSSVVADHDGRYYTETELSCTSTGGVCGSHLIGIPTLGAPTYDNLGSVINLFFSAGRVTGGTITDAGSETVNVGAGTGFIKATDDDTAELMAFNWNALNGISIPTNSVRYIGVEYNSGSPQIVTKTSNTWDLDTEFPLGSVINISSILYVMNNPWWVTDGITNIVERFQADGYTKRDDYVGGLILGTSSTNTTRKPTLTAGTVWSRLNEFLITAKDCSAGSTFYGFYRNGSGGWTRTAAKTDIDDYYDNNSGTLQPLGNNKYVNFWFFLEINGGGGNGQLMLIYPQTQYNTAAAAEAGEIPAFPKSWYEHGILLGKIIIRQGTTAPRSVKSAFTTTFNYALAADHGNLSGLADDDHSIYLLLAGRSGGQTAYGGTASGDDLTLRSTTNATKGNIIIPDGEKLSFGTGLDGNIYPSSDDLYIEVDTQDKDLIMKVNSGGTNIEFLRLDATAGVRINPDTTITEPGLAQFTEITPEFNITSTGNSPSALNIVPTIYGNAVNTVNGVAIGGYNIIGNSTYAAGSSLSALSFVGAFAGTGNTGSTNLDIYGIDITGTAPFFTNISCNDLYGIHIIPISAPAGRTLGTNVYGLYVSDGATNPGDFTNHYGIYLEAPTNGSNNYQLYLDGTGTNTGIWLDGEHIYSSAAGALKIASSDLYLNDGKKLLLGADSDYEQYESSGDIIIRALTEDKDIIYYVNDGSSDTEVMRLDGSKSMLDIAVALNLPSDTADTTAGNIRWSTSDLEPQYYDGSAWHYMGSPKQLTATDTAVAEGNNSLTGLADKYLIKYIKITTTSTQWDMTIYTSDDYATGELKIVEDRDGDYMIYLDLPWQDADSSSEFHYNFTSASGSETHNITFYGVEMK